MNLPEIDVEVARISEEAPSRPIARRMGWACLVLALAAMPALAQDAAPDRGVPLDSLPAIEQARQFLVARQFEAALIAAEDAAADVGLAAAAEHHASPVDPSEDAANVHLYRGLALELLRRFPEARADYDAFLAIEPGSWRSEELLTRYAYVTGQAVRTTARRLSDDGTTPAVEEARYGVGVFPLYNLSSVLVMSQVSFGLTGVLHNTLGLLDHFSDQSVPSMPYSQVRLLLDEVLPEDVYGEYASIDRNSLPPALEVEHLVLGTLDEVSGSLSGNLEIARFSDVSVPIGDVQANYTAVGLLDLQRDLTLTIADSIQSKTGFTYVPSRQAYADSIEQYLYDDVGKMLTYGFAVEQLLLGELVEAQALMGDLVDLPARNDLEEVNGMARFTTPPADNLLALTALAPPVVAGDPATADTLAPEAAADTVSTLPPPVVPVTEPADQEVRTAHVLSAATVRHLSGFSVWGPTTRSLRFDDLKKGDPRQGVPGTLDPTRTGAEGTGVPVDVVVPLPPTQDRPPSSSRK